MTNQPFATSNPEQAPSQVSGETSANQEVKAPEAVETQEKTFTQDAPAPSAAPEVAAQPDSSDDFAKMMEAYGEQQADLRKGSIVEGKIISIGEKDVFVSIEGCRCEGAFPTEEIRDDEGNVKFQVGDNIAVQVISSPHTDSTINLSYRQARRKDAIRQLRVAFTEGTSVDGTITEAVKGGLKVDIQGAEAFLPASQIEMGYVENTADYVGRTERFRILKFDPRRNKLVISRRVILEEERAQRKEEVWKTLEIGKIVHGRVARIAGYGVFVDLGGVEGLIHISNLSWDKVKKPSELVKVGQEIDVQVIELDSEKERIGLGLKQMMDDPWITVGERYAKDQQVNGVVEKLETFGAFVKLEPGVTALIPISEMSWTRRIDHPSEILKVGEKVDAVVLRVDTNERKISISLKQNQPSPFLSFAQRHEVGEILEGEVTNVMGYGAFVRLEEGVEGLLHISEIDWAPVRSIEEKVRKGERKTVKIINVNTVDEKISLSAKIGEPPADLPAAEPEMPRFRPVREDRGPRKGGSRRDRDGRGSRDSHDSEESRYMQDSTSSTTKLGDLFPQGLLEKMKSKRSE